MSSQFPRPASWRFERRPPKPKRPSVPLIQVENKEGIGVRILSDTMTGVWTHNIDGRTKPCTGPLGGCWLDHLRTSSEWHGWLVVARPGVQEQRLLALTLFAVDCAPELLDEALVLRGLFLKAWRFGNSRRAKMGARLTSADCNLKDLPPAVEVVPQLERMWAAPNRKKNGAGAVWEAWRKGGAK